MNIGIICNELPPAPTGGIGIFTAELIRGLVSLGHRVHVACVDRMVESDTRESISPELTIHRLAGGPGRVRGYLDRIKLFRLICRLASEQQIDLVEVPDFEGWCAGWPNLPIPIVVRLHGSATYFAAEMRAPVPAAVRLTERFAIQRADRVISVSRYTADRTKELLGLSFSPTVIYNSVALPESDRVKKGYEGRGLVCYSGTLVQKKGVFSLARAWPLIKQRCPNARLMMIGKDGRHGCRSSIQVLQELAGPYADSIDFVGHVAKQKMECLMTEADLAVYPSYSEAFALAPMEAMALGIPTIYTTRASGRELVRHGVDGSLCDPDDIEGMASEIASLLNDEPKRRRLGEAGRRRISEDFPYGISLQKNIQFYWHSITEHGRRRGGAEMFEFSAPMSKQ